MADYITQLTELFSNEVETDDEKLTEYSHDASLFEVRPTAVVSPKNTADVEKLVSWVAQNKAANPSLSTMCSGPT